MIAGYAKNGQSLESLELFRQMKKAGLKPEPKTYASVLPACANLAALEQVMEIHEEITRNGFQFNDIVANSLVDTYVKCGMIDKARDLFEKMNRHDLVSWNTMMGGYAMQGYSRESLKLFEQMQHCGMKPDDVTLLGIISACCHSGLVDEGQRYFNSMSQYYHLMPSMEHYVCIFDLLS